VQLWPSVGGAEPFLTRQPPGRRDRLLLVAAEFCCDAISGSSCRGHDEISQLGFLVQRVEAQLAISSRPDPLAPGAVEIGGNDSAGSAEDLGRIITANLDAWAGAAAAGTKAAFLRRLEAGLARVGTWCGAPPRTKRPATGSTGPPAR
jgi:hypothetical protein